MSTQLLSATLGAETGAESPVKLAITPGIIGVTAKVTAPAGGLGIVPSDSIRILLFDSNEDVTSPTVTDIVDELAATAKGEILPAIDGTADAVKVSHDEFLCTGEFLYAVVRIDKALAADVALVVNVSEL